MHLSAPEGSETRYTISNQTFNGTQKREGGRTILDDLSRLDGDVHRTLVEVEDRELSASEGGQEVDVDLGKQVVALPLERRVGLLLDDDDDVSRDRPRRLVRLASERDLLAALHSLVDVNLEHLALRDDLLGVADLALVLLVDDLSGSVTVVAGDLDLERGKKRKRGVSETLFT